MNQPCGHPVECVVCEDEDEGTCYCRWCAEVADLREQVASLMGQLEKKAVIVEAGGTLHHNGDIGYLVVAGGAVIAAAPPCVTTVEMRG